MENSKSLKGKRAVIFGAAGSIGGALAREFVAQGAEVFLSGRTKSRVQAIAKELDPTGRSAHAAEVDALDEQAVNAYLDSIVREAGRIDVVVNAIGPLAAAYGAGMPAVELTTEQFMVPLTTVVRSQFITAAAAARQMSRQGAGVILFITGSPARPHTEGAIAIGAAFAAIENMTRHLAIELGAAGIRPVCLRSSAMPDTATIKDVLATIAAATGATPEDAANLLSGSTMLHLSPQASDTAKVAAFLASDQARTITGTQVMSEIR